MRCRLAWMRKAGSLDDKNDTHINTLANTSGVQLFVELSE